MKKITTTIIATLIAGCIYGQDMAAYNSIKLFVDLPSLIANNPNLDEKLQIMLVRKLIQLVNQTGTVEHGYSNFVVIPLFEVNDVSVDKTGIVNMYLADCELSLFVKRRSYGSRATGAATFTSMAKKIFGSAESKEAAIGNAIGNIKISDNELISFFKDSRKKISDYFRTHCKDVINQANEAYQLNNYAGSLALYFSIPSDAPCYDTAKQAIQNVYTKYVNDECERNLLKLNAYIARANNTDKKNETYYDTITTMLTSLDPSNPESKSCYTKAMQLIKKLEDRFNVKQQHEWEERKKASSGELDIRKEAAKSAAKVASDYQPKNLPAIIIAH
jgi:hypothetical protein